MNRYKNVLQWVCNQRKHAAIDIDLSAATGVEVEEFVNTCKQYVKIQEGATIPDFYEDCSEPFFLTYEEQVEELVNFKLLKEQVDKNFANVIVMDIYEPIY